jgi:hypothetical protein
MSYNYEKICKGLLEDLPQRTQEIISQRFGLSGNQRQTLESIGKNYGLTRERVRQIEQNGFSKIHVKIKQCANVFQYFNNELKKTGDLRKEDALLQLLGKQKFQNQVFFLLTLGNPFQRFTGTKEFYTLWTSDARAFFSAQKIIKFLGAKLQKAKQPLQRQNLISLAGSLNAASVKTAPFYLEVSKTIRQGPEGLFGLKHWPEINPRGVKDWAYLVLKKQKKPCHFTNVAELIDKLYSPKYKTLSQTVHNELIKDQRFVLVGRGLYALKEWGYESGTTRDIIANLLKNTRKPLSQKEIVDKTLDQRFIKRGTILLNLNNKEHFLKNEEGKYIIKQV